MSDATERPDPSAPVPLAYGIPPPRAVPKLVPALCLSLPGAACWAVYLIALPVGSAVRRIAGHVFWPLLVCALLAAVTSVLMYARSPKPWHVWVNLTINVGGILFAAYWLVVAATAAV